LMVLTTFLKSPDAAHGNKYQMLESQRGISVHQCTQEQSL
jgi:hypothetical protein